MELEREQDPEPAEKTEELRREKERLREPTWQVPHMSGQLLMHLTNGAQLLAGVRLLAISWISMATEEEEGEN